MEATRKAPVSPLGLFGTRRGFGLQHRPQRILELSWTERQPLCIVLPDLFRCSFLHEFSFFPSVAMAGVALPVNQVAGQAYSLRRTVYKSIACLLFARWRSPSADHRYAA